MALIIVVKFLWKSGIGAVPASVDYIHAVRKGYLD